MKQWQAGRQISPTMQKKIRQLARRLLECSQKEGAVYLYPHVDVDGDALGSSLALLLALEKLDITAVLPLDEPVPANLEFLPALDRIWHMDQDSQPQPEQALALLLDCAEISRLGKRASLPEQAAQTWVLDHHILGREAGEREIIDTSAAAVAELVYHLIRLLEEYSGRKLRERDCAVLLLAGLISDTGGFVFSNTTKRSFSIAADLMDDQIDLQNINYQLFHKSSQARLCLMGQVFCKTEYHLSGRLALCLVDQATLAFCGASDDDLEGIINYLRNVSGVDLALILRQQADGTIKLNIRSSEAVDAARLAAAFAGGGHARAAGASLIGMDLAKAKTVLMQKAGELL